MWALDCFKFDLENCASTISWHAMPFRVYKHVKDIIQTLLIIFSLAVYIFGKCNNSCFSS